jgi:hypothetical protein
MAATNKCLAQRNKSSTGANATKNSEARMRWPGALRFAPKETTMRMAPLLAGMLLATLTTAANAAEIKVTHTTNYPTTVSITGNIEPGDFERFYEATKNLPSENVWVDLQSNGGVIIVGLAIGSRIHDGSQRAAPEEGGTIGFHAAYNKSDGRESGAANALVGSYLKELGFGWETIFYLTKTGPNEIEWLDRAKAKKYGINFDGIFD